MWDFWAGGMVLVDRLTWEKLGPHSVKCLSQQDCMKLKDTALPRGDKYKVVFVPTRRNLASDETEFRYEEIMKHS